MYRRYSLIILESSSEPQFPFIHSLWAATQSSRANNLYRLRALKYWVFKRELSHVFSIHILIHDGNSHHTDTSTKSSDLLNVWRSEGGSSRRNKNTRKHQTWLFFLKKKKCNSSLLKHWSADGSCQMSCSYKIWGTVLFLLISFLL